jgi:hypothetical protein
VNEDSLNSSDSSIPAYNDSDEDYSTNDNDEDDSTYDNDSSSSDFNNSTSSDYNDSSFVD